MVVVTASALTVALVPQALAASPASTSVSGIYTHTQSAPVGRCLPDGVQVTTGGKHVKRTVQVQRQKAGSSTWSTIKTATTSSTGSYMAQFCVSGGGTWHFRVVATPTSRAKRATSASRSIVGQTVWLDKAATDKVLQMTNAFRRSHQVRALSTTSALNKMAGNWSKTMASRSLFAHNPNFFAQIPGGHHQVGENVVMTIGVKQRGAALAPILMNSWEHSAPHRANLLNARYSKVGIAVYCNTSSCYATQDFWG